MRVGQPIGAVARGLGISDQTARNWEKAEAAGRLAAMTIKPFTAKRVEIARLKAELAQVMQALGLRAQGEEILCDDGQRAQNACFAQPA